MPHTTKLHILLKTLHKPNTSAHTQAANATLVLQLISELEELQQQLFQQKQQVIALTAQNRSMQAELESSHSRLQGEAERAALHQEQLEAERKLRMQRSEEVRCAMLCFVLCCAVLCCAVLSFELI